MCVCVCVWGGGVACRLANYSTVYGHINKTESQMFVTMCVVCCQRQPFRRLFPKSAVDLT